ncbi:MAG: hypothetical protein RLZZ436_1935 [Planctomycetota bacterium]
MSFGFVHFHAVPEQIRSRPLSLARVVEEGNFEISSDGGSGNWQRDGQPCSGILQMLASVPFTRKPAADQLCCCFTVPTRHVVLWIQRESPKSPSQVQQNTAVSPRNSQHPAVLAKSKLTDRRVLRFALICSQRTPHNKTPMLAGTFQDTRDLRLSGLANSAISPLAPPPTSWTPFPTQLSPLSDSHIAPGYHPFGPHRMSKYTQLRSVSSLRRSEI